MERKKKDADFQDEYRKSSNFSKLNENESEKLKVKGDGDVKLKEDSKMKAKADKETIDETLKDINSEEE